MVGIQEGLVGSEGALIMPALEGKSLECESKVTGVVAELLLPKISCLRPPLQFTSPH